MLHVTATLRQCAGRVITHRIYVSLTMWWRQFVHAVPVANQISPVAVVGVYRYMARAGWPAWLHGHFLMPSLYQVVAVTLFVALHPLTRVHPCGKAPAQGRDPSWHSRRRMLGVRITLQCS